MPEFWRDADGRGEQCKPEGGPPVKELKPNLSYDWLFAAKNLKAAGKLHDWKRSPDESISKYRSRLVLEREIT